MPTLTSHGSPSFAGSAATILQATNDGFSLADLRGLLNSQGWVAARYKPNYPSTAIPAHGPTIFAWLDDFSKCVRVIVDSDSKININTGAANPGQYISWAANDSITVVAAWAAGDAKCSLNGAAFTVATGGAPSGITNTEFQIGNQLDFTRAAAGKILWLALGTGTLSDADAATINAFGDTDPSACSSLPGTCTFLWKADDLNYLTDVVTQTAEPAVDVSAGGWSPSTGGSLYACIDESSPDAADYIYSPSSPTSAAEAKVGLKPIPDPGVGTDHSWDIQFKKNATGGDRIDLTVTLYRHDGTTAVKSVTYTNIDAVQTVNVALSSTEADSIPTGDYTGSSGYGLVMGYSAIKV